ncbi:MULTISPECIES: Gfo/Idh/MocA family oxidoreductase [Flavobacteriaceae]|uniref:Gfo/Idh/MocA family oxidoreductase n=1 Tax=Flavobacteriaceae TaxID=49546 RepID=UPI0014911969|nr:MULTISPECIES: Gfo/Idh/MocA family oxidoreductase [Allomuricauda]MDC6365916.1 Gfo/Idh/MocA family oxidoreductase [Muricauda sp. AC10]
MKPIKTALCSYGMSGYVFHAPFLELNPNFSFYGVWERTKNEAVKKYPSVKTFRTLEELLEDDNIELVVVNTPSVTHYDFAKKVIEAGKHLVVEKPFTATTAEAQELIDLANEKNLKLSVFHNRRWDSDFKTVKNVLEEGLLGEIRDVELHYDRYDTSLSYKVHKEIPTPAVGSLYDLGSHIIDQAIQLFGMPKAVFADTDMYRPTSKVMDFFDVKLFYGSFRVALKSSYYVREALPGFILHGTKGSFLKSRADVQEGQLQKGILPNDLSYGIEPKKEQGLLHTELNGAVFRKHIPSESGNYMAYYDGIYEAIRNNGSLPVLAEEAKNIITIIEAAYKSKEERRIVDL